MHDTVTFNVADQLESTVSAALSQLRALPDEAVSRRPAPDRWTVKEVIGHLIDSASNNHQRFVRAQFVGEEADFVFPKYEQSQWTGCQFYNDRPWGELLDLWATYNRHLAHVIRHVRPSALGVRCLIGPYEPVTLGFLIEDYVVHLRGHLEKVAARTGESRAR